jgi:hypothetical protein
MLRINGKALLITLALGLGASGCADNESSLFVEGILDISSSDCVARPDASATFLSIGVLDVGLADGYIAAVQVGNQVTQQGNRDKLRTETSRIHLEGATGSVFTVDGQELDFEVIGTGFVHPASGTDPGLAAMFVNIVTSQQIQTLRDAGPAAWGQMVVRFRVYGTTLGGKEIESGDYDFPISVCNGCLIEYPPSANSAPAGMPYECGGGDDENTEEANVCFLGQDQRISCTECSAVLDICRFEAQNPWYN